MNAPDFLPTTRQHNPGCFGKSTFNSLFLQSITTTLYVEGYPELKTKVGAPDGDYVCADGKKCTTLTNREPYFAFCWHVTVEPYKQSLTPPFYLQRTQRL